MQVLHISINSTETEIYSGFLTRNAHFVLKSGKSVLYLYLYIQVIYCNMAKPVIMPRQGQSVESCILTEWYKNEGDQVSQGDLLFAYETDKAAFEEEAQEDGILLARFFEPGDEVPVLANVAVIGDQGESFEPFRPDVPDEAITSKEIKPGVGTPTEADSGTGPVSDQETIRISPRARRLAREKRVVSEAIRGTGPGGRIIERDVVEAIRNGKRLTPLARRKLEGEGLAVPDNVSTPYGRISSKDLVEPLKAGTAQVGTGITGGYRDIPLSNVRKIIASAMYNSLHHSAQLTHHLSANASGMMQLRKEVKRRVNEGYPHDITLNDMVCYAVIRALKAYPEANAHFLEGKIRQFDRVNLGLAVDTERGLLVPALPGADELSLPGLSSQLSQLVEASRKGNISPDLLSPEAASFTVSNLGNYGVEMFTPVINLPQVAILGINTILQRPTALPDGTFVFQPFIGLSLTYDHRAIDGGPATRFLAEIKNQVEALSLDMI
jgi:pyruvate dehydrogenase E2 component (dihydrolipoamide acetyltransferase)